MWDICRNTYQFKTRFDHQTTWKDLDEHLLAGAEDLIVQRCRNEKLRPGKTDTVLKGLIEWKLCQIHRATQRKDDRQKKRPSDTNYRQCGHRLQGYAFHPLQSNISYTTIARVRSPIKDAVADIGSGVSTLTRSLPRPGFTMRGSAKSRLAQHAYLSRIRRARV